MENLYVNVLSVANDTNQEVKTANANKNAERFSTQRDLIAGEVCKDLAFKLLPERLGNLHKEGQIHIHDLDYAPVMPMTNCCLVNLRGMLENGFKMNDIPIEPPKSIATAMTLASQIVMAVGASQYGGISYNRFDEVLAPYVKMSYEKLIQDAKKYKIPDAERFAKDKIRKIVYDACQTFEYQVNSMTCTSGQSPFISIGYGLGLSWEEKLLQEMIMQVRIDGLGVNKVTAIFPKLIFSIKDGVNLHKSDPNYDIKQKALECSSKRLYPDIVNYDKIVETTGSFKASMGCRSYLSEWYNEKGDLQHSGRCNLGVVTVNLPLIAMDSKGCLRTFWKLLDERLHDAKSVCEFRLEYLSSVKAKSSPILFCDGGLMRLEPEDYVLPHLLKRGSSISIGYIGLNETVNALLKEDATHLQDSKDKTNLALSIVKFLDGKIKGFKEESGVGYSTYGTPSESQCKRLRDVIFDKYGIVKGVTDKEYLTNSFHLEADKQSNPYDRIDFEAQFVPFTAGGFISYGEFPDMKKNLEALEDVWDYSYTKTPYYAINTPSDKCYECGYEGELSMKSKGFTCPSCGNSDRKKMYAIRRVSGYLGNPTERPFNEGKHEECVNRKKNM